MKPEAPGDEDARLTARSPGSRDRARRSCARAPGAGHSIANAGSSQRTPARGLGHVAVRPSGSGPRVRRSSVWKPCGEAARAGRSRARCRRAARRRASGSRWRVRAQVDRDVEDRAAHAAHELRPRRAARPGSACRAACRARALNDVLPAPRPASRPCARTSRRRTCARTSRARRRAARARRRRRRPAGSRTSFTRTAAARARARRTRPPHSRMNAICSMISSGGSRAGSARSPGWSLARSARARGSGCACRAGAGPACAGCDRPCSRGSRGRRRSSSAACCPWPARRSRRSRLPCVLERRSGTSRISRLSSTTRSAKSR